MRLIVQRTLGKGSICFVYNTLFNILPTYSMKRVPCFFCVVDMMNVSFCPKHYMQYSETVGVSKIRRRAILPMR